MSKYGTPGGTTFRLSVCLKRFYNDERKRCYISVAAGLRFRWLTRRLQRLFSLPGHFCLVSAGHLLPPDERLGLLNPDDVVEVIPKLNKVFEETSNSEDEQEFNLSEYNHLYTNDQKEGIPINPKQSYTTEINELHNDQIDYPLTKQKFSKSIPCKCDYAFPNRQQVKDNRIFQEELRQTDKVYDYEQDAVKTNTSNLLEQWMSQEIKDGKLNEAENNGLDEVKRKALELLDKCSMPQKRKGIVEAEDEDNVGLKANPAELLSNMPEKRKRKRVRRRKPCIVAVSEDNIDSIGAEDKTLPLNPDDHKLEGHSNQMLKDNYTESTLSETLILRNNIEQNRTARLVYPLL
ncbi:uncharacterized protein LOC128682532 [Plodia interpunctella]|uniref:uncharacterized protein LOC128682532 n=1 Tax=Plodia interpunctella TaxID=58824 RepID=UPI002367C361|nr:uncharacterized protein LOC128682532 [Plodia interpunctella]